MPEKMQLKKILVRNVAFLRNINCELRSLSRSRYGAGFERQGTRVQIQQMYQMSLLHIFVIEWFNFRIIFFWLALCGVEPVDC